ncbi:MAG: hypothetical protein ABI700_13595 [Chloroflexota bacterium]
MKKLLILLISLNFVVLMAVSLSAQPSPDIPIEGSGHRGVIAYGEAVSGQIDLSDTGAKMDSIGFVGHNGSGRVQGDFDVWDFDMPKGTFSVISVTATSGDLIPTMLIVNEPQKGSIIAGVSGLDANVDGDLGAGVCLLDRIGDGHYEIVINRQAETRQTGSYLLTLEQAVDIHDLGGGSASAVCRVGTFAITQGSSRINIRSNPGLKFSIISSMQPDQPYSVFGTPSDWTPIVFWSGDQWRSGYVSTPLIRITGSMDESASSDSASN